MSESHDKTRCGNSAHCPICYDEMINQYQVTDMVATDSKPSTGHSEPPQEDPTTKLDMDRVSDILSTFYEEMPLNRGYKPGEREAIWGKATQQINSLIVEARVDELNKTFDSKHMTGIDWYSVPVEYVANRLQKLEAKLNTLVGNPNKSKSKRSE